MLLPTLFQKFHSLDGGRWTEEAGGRERVKKRGVGGEWSGGREVGEGRVEGGGRGHPEMTNLAAGAAVWL